MGEHLLDGESHRELAMQLMREAAENVHAEDAADRLAELGVPYTSGDLEAVEGLATGSRVIIRLPHD